jgi:hypothetical protein
MKKTLLESLVDYDISMLQALASTRGARLASQHQVAAARELAAQLVAPASVAIAMADLSPADIEALSALRANGGWMESPRFARRFGAVRAMGPGRLARERPWETPANSTESLWYRGLVFLGFRPADDGVVEVFYVPQDLLATLPSLPPAELLPTIPSADPPPHVEQAGEDLVEDVFGLLALLRRRPVRLDASGYATARDLQAINALCVHPLPTERLAEVATSDNRLTFLLHVCHAAGLAARQEQRLVVGREAARAWLQTTPARRHFQLQTAWRDDSERNDLQCVPSLRLHATGWRNDPLLPRQTVLRFLDGCQPQTWYRLDDLVATIKSLEPDFQRPDGDYSTWYIHDASDRPLMGFEHWDDVEGALIRHLVTCPLHWLGVVDLGSDAAGGPPTVFRVRATGFHLLGQSTLLDDQSPAPASPSSAGFNVLDDYTVRVAPDADLLDRFQLARFSDFVGRDGQTAIYRISPTGMNVAGKQGIGAAQIRDFLQRVSGHQVPQRVLDALERWQKRGAARLERVFVLHVDGPEMLTHLRQDAVLGRLLGETAGPCAVLIPQANEERVRRWLTEHGYL